MVLRLLKPSWRKIVVTAALYLMVGFSSALNKKVGEVASEDLAKSSIGERHSEEIKRIFKEVRCEANEQAVEAGQKFIKEMAVPDRDALERRALILRWIGTAVITIFCYLMACIACTGAVIRLREKS